MPEIVEKSAPLEATGKRRAVGRKSAYALVENEPCSRRALSSYL